MQYTNNFRQIDKRKVISERNSVAKATVKSDVTAAKSIVMVTNIVMHPPKTTVPIKRNETISVRKLTYRRERRDCFIKRCP